MSTKVKKVYGMVFDSFKFRPVKAPITVRFTHDKVGETLSLQYHDIMITIPYEEVASLIEEAKAGEQHD